MAGRSYSLVFARQEEQLRARGAKLFAVDMDHAPEALDAVYAGPRERRCDGAASARAFTLSVAPDPQAPLCLVVGVVCSSAATVGPLLADLRELQLHAGPALLGSLDVVLLENGDDGNSGGAAG